MSDKQWQKKEIVAIIKFGCRQPRSILTFIFSKINTCSYIYLECETPELTKEKYEELTQTPVKIGETETKVSNVGDDKSKKGE